MEQLPRAVHIPKNISTFNGGESRRNSLKELFESMYNKSEGHRHSDTWDGEPYEHDSDPDDCYCE